MRTRLPLGSEADMAISDAFTNSATISTTEYSLPNNSTTLTPITDDGVYQAFIDFANLTSTEQYEIKLYEKVTSGGSQRLVEVWTVMGAQAKPCWASPSLILLHGWDITVKKIAGTDRSIAWSIRKVA
jgi:hypothetical protein